MADVDNQAVDFLADERTRRYVEAILGAADRVDDVLQTVAERLVHDRQDVANRKGFMIAAVRNAAIDERRSSDRRAQREGQYAYVQKASTSVEQQVSTEQLLTLIDRSIRELPLLTQALFYGHYVSGRSQRDLAEEHGLHLSTVEKRIAKARQHCRRSLGEYFG